MGRLRAAMEANVWRQAVAGGLHASTLGMQKTYDHEISDRRATCVPVYGLDSINRTMFLAWIAWLGYRHTFAGYRRGCVVVHTGIRDHKRFLGLVGSYWPECWQVKVEPRLFRDDLKFHGDKYGPPTLY